MRLFVNNIVSVISRVFVAGFVVHFFNLYHFERARKCVCFGVKVGGFVALPRNNKRCARLVNKYRVNLVNYGKIMLALNLLLLVSNHIIAQVVKA